MTINKVQGQTLERVGIYLPEPCFTHGQLYVAASRVGLPEYLRFAVPIDKDTGTFRTCNVVFREALTFTHEPTARRTPPSLIVRKQVPAKSRVLFGNV